MNGSVERGATEKIRYPREGGRNGGEGDGEVEEIMGEMLAVSNGGSKEG